MKTNLIIYGAEKADDLAFYGLPVANKYDPAKDVLLVDEKNRPHHTKGANETFDDIECINLRNDLYEFRMILNRIYEAHEVAHPDSKHSHSFVGQWLFHNYIYNKKLNLSNTVLECISNGNLDLLNKSADDFIEHDFGMSESCILMPSGEPRTDTTPA